MDATLASITDAIREKLNDSGIFNILLARKKTYESIEKKVRNKGENYYGESKKIQDLYGIRVVLYFTEDIDTAVEIVSSLFAEIIEERSIDKLGPNVFGATRHNRIYRLSTGAKSIKYRDFDKLIDDTFEVQFRTIFTEGILEIEHDFRYKYKDTWPAGEGSLERVLYSIIASLESKEWAIDHLLSELAFNAYKCGDWESLLRNKLKIRISDRLDEMLKMTISSNSKLPKEIFKTSRKELLSVLGDHFSRIPLSYDNVVYVLNCKKFRIKEILDMTPKAILWEIGPQA